MSRNHKECSICSHPDGAKIVNALLEKGTFLKVIAQQTGFSKSSVHRHSLKCVIRQQAAKLKSSRFDPHTDKLVVHWPGDPIPPNLTEHDVIFSVQYAPPVPRGPYCPASAFVVEQALAEDAERDAAKQIPTPLHVSSKGNHRLE
jgi:hypothetical protein